MLEGWTESSSSGSKDSTKVPEGASSVGAGTPVAPGSCSWKWGTSSSIYDTWNGALLMEVEYQFLIDRHLEWRWSLLEVVLGDHGLASSDGIKEELLGALLSETQPRATWLLWVDVQGLVLNWIMPTKPPMCHPVWQQLCAC